MTQGYFAPESVTRRLARERVLLAGGPRALLMQVAHPLVAAGVAEHSRFPQDALKRLRRTLDATLTIVFGTREEADAAAARVNAVHGRVHGTLPESVGRYAQGTPYDAFAPELLLWVHATLVDTTLTVYPRFVAPLSEDDEERAYQESKIAARLLRTPPEVLPDTLADFRAYMRDMVSSGSIAIGAFQRRLARDILHPPLFGVPRPAWRLAAAMTLELLPPQIRDAYGIETGDTAARIASYAPRVSRAVVSVAPGVVRLMPQARRAHDC